MLEFETSLSPQSSGSARPTSPDKHTHISDLPFEIIELILGVSYLIDVSAFAQTCRTYRTLVYEPVDNHLWRSLFLNQPEFDDPRLGLEPASDVPWDMLLQRWTATTKVLRSREPKFTHEVLEGLLEMVKYARPAAGPLALDSQNLACVEGLLATSGFFNTVLKDSYASRLAVYTGLDGIVPTPARRLQARSFVYDLRNYHNANSHGPFMPDGSGRVNWAHVHAIQEVIAMNLADFVDNVQSGLPMSLKHIQAQSIPRAKQGVVNATADWAGLDGKWQVVFCFCDHRDLLAFNRLNPWDPQALQTTPNPTIFEDVNFEEALRFLEFDLELVSVEEPAMAAASCRARPTLYFVGTVSGNARVKGRVYMTPDEEVRWSFVSGEPGQTIWSTEAIQVGGIASAFGALGCWTTVFHDSDDPVGPMWLWKLA